MFFLSVKLELNLLKIYLLPPSYSFICQCRFAHWSEHSHFLRDTLFSAHSDCHCFAFPQYFYFGKSNTELNFLWKAHTAPENQWSELSKPVPFISPSITTLMYVSTVTHTRCSQDRAQRRRKGYVAAKSFKPGSSPSCPKDMNFLFSQWDWKHYHASRNTKKIQLLEN